VVSIGAVVMFTCYWTRPPWRRRSASGRPARVSDGRFTDAAVSLVLAGRRLLALAGGGLGLAKLFTLSGDPTGGMLPVFYLGGQRIALGLVIAMSVGLLAGAIPALGAMRLRIVDAMRRV
jgi:putative ABC transport system permease protein